MAQVVDLHRQRLLKRLREIARDHPEAISRMTSKDVRRVVSSETTTLDVDDARAISEELTEQLEIRE